MPCKKVVGIIVFRLWQKIHYGQIMGEGSVHACMYMRAVVEIDNKMK